MLRQWLCLFISFCSLLSLPRPVFGAGQNQRLQELKLLRNQLQSTLQLSPKQREYILKILTLSAGTAAWAAATQATRLQAAEIIKQAQNNKTPQGRIERPSRYLMSKKSPQFTGSLFDPPAPKDLSWLDEPHTPLAPRPAQPSLFGDVETKVKPKTYLSKRIMQDYRPRLERLPIAEQEGLIEALDEAVARKKTAGRSMAIRFLEQKAAQSATTSLYLIIAKRMLVLSGILLASDVYWQVFSSADKPLQRLAANPALLAQATDEDLSLLARHPHSVDLCWQIVNLTQQIALSSLSQEEKQWIEQMPLSPALPKARLIY